MADKRFHITVSESGSLAENEKPGFLAEFPSVEKIFSRASICANQNVSKAILHNCYKGPEYVMYMNDDSEVHESFPDEVIKFLDKYPLYPCWSFYNAYDFITLPLAKEGKDIWDYPYKLYYGSLCWTMKRKDANNYALYLHNYFQDGFRKAGNKLTQKNSTLADLQLSKFLKKTYPKKNIGAHIPSLVNHVGTISNMICAKTESNYFHKTEHFKSGS